MVVKLLCVYKMTRWLNMSVKFYCEIPDDCWDYCKKIFVGYFIAAQVDFAKLLYFFSELYDYVVLTC